MELGLCFWLGPGLGLGLGLVILLDLLETPLAAHEPEELERA